MAGTMWWRLGGPVVGVILLVGCSTPVPAHETPDWDALIQSVRAELSEIEPDPAGPGDAPGSPDPLVGLTRSSPNAVETDLEDLVVGDCFLYPLDEDGTLKNTVQVVPCEEPHFGEVFASGEFTDAEYSDSFDEIVTAICEEQFESYVGIDYWSSGLYFWRFVPSEYGWGTGFRSWRCYALEPDFENEGSIRGSGG